MSQISEIAENKVYTNQYPPLESDHNIEWTVSVSDVSLHHADTGMKIEENAIKGIKRRFIFFISHSISACGCINSPEIKKNRDKK